MPPRLYRTLQALILAGLGAMLLEKVGSGTLSWYLSGRFTILVLGAAVGCLALAGAALPAWRAALAGEASPPRDYAHSAQDPHRAGGSLPAAGPPASAWRLFILALPLLLGLLVPAHPLESSALANKGINSAATIAGAGSAAAWIRPDRDMPNLLDWVRISYAEDNPRDLAGQRADVIGFVYHDRGLPPDEFILARFVANCCAAEAAGVGLRVRWPNAAALEDDTWVRVRGLVQGGTYAGQPIPVVVAEQVEGIEAPAQPYLYP